MPRPRVTQADTVLDAAARHLAAHGTAGTTIDDVAREAGVSRATVYRYVGGKNDIVASVIGRETQGMFGRFEQVIAEAPNPEELFAGLVSTAVESIGESPVLARLAGADLRETLAFITVDSSTFVDGVVVALSSAIAAASRFELDDETISLAVEEATRLVLGHLTTPRRDGSRLSPDQLGDRAAILLWSLLQPEPG